MGTTTASKLSVSTKHPNITTPPPVGRLDATHSKVKAGPFLHFLSQDTEKKVWDLSMMLVTEHHEGKTTLPKVTLNGSPIDGKIVAEAQKHLFVRYPFSVSQTEHNKEATYTVGEKKHHFQVPGIEESTRLAAFSCNGYQNDEHRKELGGIQSMWRRFNEEHNKNFFHIMLGLGDQIYSDGLVGKAEEPRHKNIRGVFALPLLQDWLAIPDNNVRNNTPFTAKMGEEVTEFFLEHYIRQWNEPEFKEALASIPSLMVADDHDLFDGFGSYPPELQNSSVFQGIFSIALQFYLIFQQQATLDEVGNKKEFVGDRGLHFLKTIDNDKTAILGLDTRSERTENKVISSESWSQIANSLEKLPKSCKHLLIMVGVPVAYPSLERLDDLLEGAKEDSIMEAILEQLPGFKNQFRLWELADDGRDHWGHDAHVEERSKMISLLENFARERGVRVTLLSGDVHLGGAGKIFNLNSHKWDKLGPETIWQVTTSPIGNMPAPNMVVSYLKVEGGDGEQIDHDHAMTLGGLRNEDSESISDKLIGSRNYATLTTDKTDTLKVELRVEAGSDDEGRKKPHKVYHMAIPPVSQERWANVRKQLPSNRSTAAA